MSTRTAPALVPGAFPFTARALEQALLDELKLLVPEWCDAYNLPKPRSWEVNSEPSLHAESQRPAISVISPAAARSYRRGDGSSMAEFRIEAIATISHKTETGCRTMCQAYAAVLRTLLGRMGSLGGLVNRWRFVEERYDAVEVTARRTLGGVRVVYAATGDRVLEEFGPKHVGEWPRFQTADATVVRYGVEQQVPQPQGGSS